MGQAFHIKTTAADDDGCFISGDDFCNGCPCKITKPLGIAQFAGFNDAVEMMRHFPEVGFTWLCGADVEAAIKLECVSVDDLAADAFGKGDGQCGFARGGGADDIERLRCHVSRRVCFRRAVRVKMTRKNPPASAKLTGG